MVMEWRVVRRQSIDSRYIVTVYPRFACFETLRVQLKFFPFQKRHLRNHQESGTEYTEASRRRPLVLFFLQAPFISVAMTYSSSSRTDDEKEVDEVVTEIPVVDLALVYKNDDENEEEEAQMMMAARALVTAFRQIGFATLVNHGVASETIQNGFTASKKFFALPLGTKMQYKYQSHTSNRGYISMGSEKFESLTQPDRKETYDIGKEGEAGFQTPWPMELQPDGFKDDLLRYFADFNALNLRLMKLLAMGLGLDDVNFFVDRCNEQHCNLRLLHYPELQRDSTTTTMSTGETSTTLKNPTTLEPTATIVRGAIHTDYGSITLLAQDDIGGLRAQRLDGSWIGVQPVDGSIIVNVGDMFERWTNGLFTATPHQVIDLPRYKDIIPERYSIAFFCNVNKDVVLDPMTNLMNDGAATKKTYEPIKAIDYITMRLSQTISST